MGLFMDEDAEDGDFVAIYSGDALDRHQCELLCRAQKNYVVKIHNNLYLNAFDKKNKKGSESNHRRSVEKSVAVVVAFAFADTLAFAFAAFSCIQLHSICDVGKDNVTASAHDADGFADCCLVRAFGT